MRIRIIIIIIVIIIIAFLAWLFWASTRPLPGQKQIDEGRGHVQIGTEVDYNSNPPTSGEHYEDWIRAGIYTESKDDRNLVHSLEHGYVVMHYKCNLDVIATPSEERGKQSSASEEIARLAESAKRATPASGEARNDENWVNTQEDCDQRKAQLEEVYDKKGKRKLIVVVRPSLDTNFALTAWNYLDKFDSFDAERIEKFIDVHRDNGPERTME